VKTITKSELYSAADKGIIKYMDQLSQGSGIVHPDVEERMKELSDSLNGMLLRKYRNSTVIKSNHDSTIVAVAFGTAYSVKAGSMFTNAIDSGARTFHQWSDGTKLDLIRTFGHDWIVGTWNKNETNWIQSGNA
jgi:hypothetical protein